MSDIKDVFVPDLGEDEVEVIELCVSPGDSVEAEDALVTVESDKASMDVPAPFAGTVKELCVNVGDKIKQSDLLAKLEVAGAGAAPAASEPEAPAAPAAAEPPAWSASAEGTVVPFPSTIAEEPSVAIAAVASAIAI